MAGLAWELKAPKVIGVKLTGESTDILEFSPTLVSDQKKEMNERKHTQIQAKNSQINEKQGRTRVSRILVDWCCAAPLLCFICSMPEGKGLTQRTNEHSDSEIRKLG